MSTNNIILLPLARTDLRFPDTKNGVIFINSYNLLVLKIDGPYNKNSCFKLSNFC